AEIVGIADGCSVQVHGTQHRLQNTCRGKGICNQNQSLPQQEKKTMYMLRGDLSYYADFIAGILKHWKSGDTFTPTRTFSEPSKCRLCGNKVPITECYEWENDRTKVRIVCGIHCNEKFPGLLQWMNQLPTNRIPVSSQEQVQRNRKYINILSERLD